MSYLGLSQVKELAEFLEKSSSAEADKDDNKIMDADIVKVLRADPGAPNSRILSSNVRRALSTIAGGFRDRLSRRPNDKIFILSCLQEISRVCTFVLVGLELE